MRADLCRRCEGELAPDDLRCAVCGLAPELRWSHPQGEAVQLVRCPNCHAAMSYRAEVGAPSCPYCATTMRMELQPDPVEQAEATLPFLVDGAAAREALRGWMKRLGFFRPSDLASTATLESLKPQWWPAWLFSVAAAVSWSADSDHKRRHAMWAPQAGQDTVRFEDVLVSASHGLSHEECAALTPRYDLASARAVPSGPGDATVERFDLPRSSVRRRIVASVEARAHAMLTSQLIPGSVHRKVKSAVLLRRLSTRRLSLPAWVLAYRYRGKLYRAVIHGQDASLVLGKAPWSWGKIAGVVAALVGLLALAIVLANQ